MTHPVILLEYSMPGWGPTFVICNKLHAGGLNAAGRSALESASHTRSHLFNGVCLPARPSSVPQAQAQCRDQKHSRNAGWLNWAISVISLAWSLVREKEIQQMVPIVINNIMISCSPQLHVIYFSPNPNSSLDGPGHKTKAWNVFVEWMPKGTSEWEALIQAPLWVSNIHRLS